jgi:HK97 family phage major capsid protein
MEEKIKSLLSEGKSDSEIASALSAKELSEGMSAQEVAEKVFSVKKSEEALVAMKKLQVEKEASEAKSAQEKAISEKVDTLVVEKLKSINIDPSGSQFKSAKSVTSFNKYTGKIEEVRSSEAKGLFINMISALGSGDQSSAKSISNEIDKENDSIEAHKYSALGIKVPSVSDVTTRGGFAIPTEVSDEINQLTYERSVMLGISNKDNVIFEDKVYPLIHGMSVSDIADQSTALTETAPTYVNPTVDMKRFGAFTDISNTLLRQKGANLSTAITSAFASEIAKFLDLRLAVGSVTGNSDLVNGIAFDANTSKPAALTLSTLTLEQLAAIKNSLAPEADLSSTYWIANRNVSDQVGLIDDSGNNRAFPDYVNGGSIAPYGIKWATNPQIPATLDIAAPSRTSGTDNVLFLCDMSKIVTAVTEETRIETSTDFKFTSDLTTFRVIKRYGQKVLSAAGTAGVVAVAQELN